MQTRHVSIHGRQICTIELEVLPVLLKEIECMKQVLGDVIVSKGKYYNLYDAYVSFYFIYVDYTTICHIFATSLDYIKK